MNKHIEYKEGNHSEFVRYLYSEEPKPINTIQLELPLVDETKNTYHHVFEQLLMIFVDGLKFFYGDTQGKVTVDELTKDDIMKLDLYFHSMNYKILISVFPTIHEYQFKYPNYLQEPHKINQETQLNDFFYEIFCKDNVVYRIQFDNIR